MRVCVRVCLCVLYIISNYYILVLPSYLMPERRINIEGNW